MLGEMLTEPNMIRTLYLIHRNILISFYTMSILLEFSQFGEKSSTSSVLEYTYHYCFKTKPLFNMKDITSIFILLVSTTNCAPMADALYSIRM